MLVFQCCYVNTDCCGAFEVRDSAGREKGVMGDRSTDGYHVPFVLCLIKALLIKAVDEGRERKWGKTAGEAFLCW